ncbi:hypothetical protein BJ878DRAFT_253204 [Calycina marina]|uniref:Uncharacterized protein n=1 Tax=Calycina marina TaxID=1763456 RepID=A0A9P7Z7R8_9HELO|nr:hypothetical protein BJ878DRAFT_253204 [Calycina marina]
MVAFHSPAARHALSFFFGVCLLTSPLFVAATTEKSACQHLSLSNWTSILDPWNVPTTPSEQQVQGQLWVLAISENDMINEVAFTQAVNDNQQTNSNNQCAILDCSHSPILCYSWLINPPSLMHIHRAVHRPLQPPSTEWRRIPLDENNTISDIEHILTMSSWTDVPVWDGFLHPYNGALGQYGGGYIWGIIAYYTSFIPNWLLILGGTLLVRRLLSKIQPDEPMMTAAYRVVPPENLNKFNKRD